MFQQFTTERRRTKTANKGSYGEAQRTANVTHTDKTMTNYYLLASAVIEQAAEDYRYTARKWRILWNRISMHYARYSDVRRLEILEELKMVEDELLFLEKFFNSDSYVFVIRTEGDGKSIIRRLIKECGTEKVNRDRTPKPSPYSQYEEVLEFFTSNPARRKKMREKENNK